MHLLRLRNLYVQAGAHYVTAYRAIHEQRGLQEGLWFGTLLWTSPGSITGVMPLTIRDSFLVCDICYAIQRGAYLRAADGREARVVQW